MKTVIIMLIVSVILIGAFVGINAVMGSTTPPSNLNPGGEENDPNRFNIGVTGEVTRPGTYSIPIGSTLSTLIAAAGGVNANADELCYFSDVVCQAKVTYYIAPRFDVGDVCSVEPLEKVNVNLATAEELITLNGVNTTVSQNIVSYRKEKGNFKTLEQLMEVTGIGNATYVKLRNYVTLKNA